MTKITNFGVFVELETDLEGLLHVSELSDEHVDDPHKAVELGQQIEVKILRVDAQDRKIGLSKKRADWAADAGEDGEAGGKSGASLKLRRGGLHGSTGEATTDIISGTVLLNNGTAAAEPQSSEPAATVEEPQSTEPAATVEEPQSSEPAADKEAESKSEGSK